MLTTIAGGLADQVTLLPLSGHLWFSNASADVATQVVPVNLVFTTLRGRIVNQLALALIGTTISVNATLFHAPAGGAVLVPTALSCVASPALTGIIPIGFVADFNCGAFAIPFSAGDLGYVELSMTAAGVTLINTLTVQAAISLAIQ